MLKILIVDDDPDMRILLSKMITRLGYTISEAGDGFEAELIASDWQPDIILMDLMMPRQDGLVTCFQLRQKGYSGHILLMSAHSSVIARQGGLEAARTCGANDFLQKPIISKQLEAYLASIAALSVSPLRL